MANLLIRSLAKSVFLLLAACPPVVWAESVARECTTDTFVEVVPGRGPRPIPNETFGMRITRSSVGFVGSGYFNNYQEPMIDHHSSDRFLAGRDYVRIVFDYPLLRLTYFNRQTVLVVTAECR